MLGHRVEANGLPTVVAADLMECRVEGFGCGGLGFRVLGVGPMG